MVGKGELRMGEVWLNVLCDVCTPLFYESLDRLEASWGLGGAKVGSELGLQGRGEGRKE